MRYHHTKNKGDLGVLHAQLDLARRGYGVLLPVTEHEAFDLVVYKHQCFLRVQVKYRAAVNGVIKFPLSSVWADRKGNHLVPIDRSCIDLICVYCPTTDACYYLDPALCGDCVTLRVEATRNKQSKGVIWARDFTEIPASALGVPAGLAPGLERMPFVRHSREPRATWLSSTHSSAG